MEHRPDPPRASRRPVTDRWLFKPVALVLLVTTIAAAATAMAVIIAPPFLGAGLAVRELDRRLDAAGADFTRIPAFPQRSTIYANDGRTVLAHVYLDNREIVPLKDISPAFQKAVLAIEDSTFYEHGALNVNSMIRAVSENLQAGEVVQGGSTITQQLVKNTLGLDPNDLSIERKFQEAALAIKVEQRYDKEKILAMYLNQVFLGNNVYGIATASQFYFHKDPIDLTLAESAMLAGMIRAPAYYDPIERPRKAWLRRNDVLNRMITLGPDWLTEQRGEKIKQTSLGLAKNIGRVELPEPPFIVSYVKEQIREDPNGWYAPVLGETPKERDRSLAEGGLQIVTTLDPQWQRAAQRAADQPWADTPAYPNRKPPADIGVVSIENDTGAIGMMLSGKDYDHDQVNTVTTPHQPGSSFKPYILATALTNGIPPTATYSGAQTPIDDPRCTTNGQPWVPQNAEGFSQGTMDLYSATADSVNLVFARLILDAGLQETVDMAHAMGVTSELPPVCALATGSVGITPLDQASGYQTIANGGVHCEPYAVASISRGDQLLYTHRPDCERVLSRTVAAVITDMMVGVVEHGTAAGPLASFSPWPIAGKTGTANENTNVWFGGFTDQVTTAVWVGSQGVPFPLREYFGGDVFGSTVAAPIWRDYMATIMRPYDPVEFPVPELVSVPRVIGMTEQAAKDALHEAHFKVAVKTMDSYLPAGTVAEQAPDAGVRTIPNTTVTIYLSTGDAPMSLVPSVVGLPTAVASARLRALNFFVNVVEKPVDDEELDRVVLGQLPKPGTELAEGSTVTLNIGAFEEKGGGTPSPEPEERR